MLILGFVGRAGYFGLIERKFESLGQRDMDGSTEVDQAFGFGVNSIEHSNLFLDFIVYYFFFLVSSLVSDWRKLFFGFTWFLLITASGRCLVLEWGDFRLPSSVCVNTTSPQIFSACVLPFSCNLLSPQIPTRLPPDHLTA